MSISGPVRLTGQAALRCVEVESACDHVGRPLGAPIRTIFKRVSH